jgi:hypothetical protein
MLKGNIRCFLLESHESHKSLCSQDIKLALSQRVLHTMNTVLLRVPPSVTLENQYLYVFVCFVRFLK